MSLVSPILYEKKMDLTRMFENSEKLLYAITKLAFIRDELQGLKPSF